MVRSLCDKKFIEKNGRKVEVVVHCHEQRVSNLMQAVIIGMALFYIKGVGYLPIAALDGLFVCVECNIPTSCTRVITC